MRDFFKFVFFFNSDADREYQRIAEYKKSTAYEQKNLNISNNKKRLDEMSKRSKTGQALTKEENCAKFVLQGTIKIDENDRKATEMDYDYYLDYAMMSYLKCITMESDANTSNRSHIFRVFSLWLANKSNDIANKTLEKYLEKVPSYKFVPLIPQITTHLSPDCNVFNQLIKQIVGKCRSAIFIHSLRFSSRNFFFNLQKNAPSSILTIRSTKYSLWPMHIMILKIRIL